MRPELWILVFTFLPARQTRVCPLVCRHWADISVDEPLWKSLAERDFGKEVVHQIAVQDDVPKWKNRYLLAARRELITIAVIGDKDSGKTSLVNHLIYHPVYKGVLVTKPRLNRSSQDLGGTFDASRWSIHLPTRRLNIIDLPGTIPNSKFQHIFLTTSPQAASGVHESYIAAVQQQILPWQWSQQKRTSSRAVSPYMVNFVNTSC